MQNKNFKLNLQIKKNSEKYGQILELKIKINENK